MCAMIEKLRIREVSGTVLRGDSAALYRRARACYRAAVPPFPTGCRAMANIASQIKRNRQNTKRRARNLAIRSEMKTRIKRAEVAAESNDAAAASEALREAQKRIDTAVAKGALHGRTAARRKSRLARRVAQRLR
jgi:small subunit ribosomal protein S20